MTLIAQPAPPRAPTAAVREAEANLQANLRALGMATPRRDQHVELVYARDGALTAKKHGRWWSGCSVPRLTANAVLRTLELKGAVACFLAPTHPAQIRAALDKLRPEQAIVVVMPDESELMVALHLEDFSRDMESHRLWLACGARWAEQLAALFEEHPGLATPAQFIRLPLNDDAAIGPMIATAQRVFADVASKRAAAMNELRRGSTPVTDDLCVVAPSRFRLWNDVGGAMLGAMRAAPASIRWRHFDPDDPASSSPLALARVVRSCRAVLTANTSRGDLPAIVPDDVPWLTWVTTPRIPRYSAAGARDALLVVNARAQGDAIKHGWPPTRVRIAGWPKLIDAPASPAKPVLAIIADTRALERPKDLNDYSSHGLLWDLIRDELLDDPFRLGDDIAGYLANRMGQLHIADTAFPRARFIDELIVPAYQQGIARVLAQGGIAMRTLGQGWGTAAGAIDSRDSLISALRAVTAVLNVSPVSWPHPCEFCGARVIARPRDRNALLLAARRTLAGTFDRPAESPPPLSFAMISELLESC